MKNPGNTGKKVESRKGMDFLVVLAVDPCISPFLLVCLSDMLVNNRTARTKLTLQQANKNTENGIYLYFLIFLMIV